MRIYIPTRGRANKQTFYDNLPAKTMSECVFVCKKEDLPRIGQHDDPAGQWAKEPAWVKNCADARAFALMHFHDTEEFGPYAAIVDDDVYLSVRRDDDPTKFRRALPTDYADAVQDMEDRLRLGYAHVTLMSREGANRRQVDEECTRAFRIHAYNVEVLRREKVDFRRCPVKEDFDTTLQLLRKGYKNIAICDYVHDDAGSQAPGGCSIYRDAAMLTKAANDLAAFHPGFVKVVQKPDKGTWGGARTDVVISWKKAYEESQSWKK